MDKPDERTPFMDGEEFKRRVREAWKLRNALIRLRADARQAYRDGTLAYEPDYDVREDYDFWAKWYEGKLREESEAGGGGREA